jgi:hypothetical protein
MGNATHSKGGYSQEVNMKRLRSRLAIGAMVVSLTLAVAACDNDPGDNDSTTTPVESTTTTGG